MSRILLPLLLAGTLALAPTNATACSTILVGQKAASNGAVLMSHSCDGDVMGLIYVMPAQSYPPGTRLPMYWNVPRPKTYEEYQANLRKGYDQVGTLPVSQTYRSLILAGNLESMTTGGLNEHGLNIAIEFIPMRKGLACDRGRVGPNSNHWTTSLIANGLLRAKTARQAIRLIGAMVEEYGFLYYRAPSAGVALPIADGDEIWLMEIFGPGSEWTPDCGRPGGVWCAQRIPDGEVGCTANRSRIGAIDLNDSDHFLASKNIFSLAEGLGFWKSGAPFIWSDVYGGPGDRSNSLREWRALSLAAPSLGLKFTGNPALDRYPFSVKPDQPLSVPKLMNVMRDGYEGTEFDLTTQAAFKVRDGQSPLACPWGPQELLDLLGLKPERAICTPTSGYVFVAELRKDLPAPIGNLLWFAYGPANTSCFVPLYAGVTDLPDAWDHPANFTRIDRQQPQWNFRLVHNLSQRLQYQEAIKDIHQMIKPAEERYLKCQAQIEQDALRVFQEQGPKATEAFLTTYASDCASNVGFAYSELTEYLMLRYLAGETEFARPALPRIAAPAVPDPEVKPRMDANGR
ncbi:MAG: C69 family dipeptidase [Verrucomicrobia bacterium]|nr:C69 family dipeptidase [Verrucomicrobiota bacterium]